MEEGESTVVETESGPSDNWQTVTKKTRSKPEACTAIAEKKTKDTVREKRTVYVRGRQGYNLAKEVAFTDAAEFKKAIHSLAGDFESTQLVGDCIRVTMKTEQQAQQLLPVDTIMGNLSRLPSQGGYRDKTMQHTVSPPPKQANNGPKVSSNGSPRTLAPIPSFRRQAPSGRTSNGVKSPTRAVIVAFLGNKLYWKP